MSARVAMALGVLAGCFDPQYHAPRCGPGGECPPGLFCRSETCIASPIDAPDAPSGAWWDPAWLRRNLITVQLDRLDGLLAGYPLVDFPVLVQLTPATIDYAAINADGSDLRFVLADDATVVPHEIDTFVQGGTSLVWVRLPAINPSAPQLHFWVYHRNASAASSSDGAAVFASNHVSVHHFSAALTDATRHGHDGVTPLGVPGYLPGAIGLASNFNGSDEYVTLLGESAYDATTSLSVSVWIKVTSFNVLYQCIVCKGDNTWRLHRHDVTDFVGFGTTSSTASDNHNGDVSIPTDTWRHTAITFDGNFKRIYVDGVLDLAAAYNKTLDRDNTQVAIGRNENAATGGGRYWQGDIDEVRISAQPRSDAWLAAEHRMVTDPQLVTLGPDESRP